MGAIIGWIVRGLQWGGPAAIGYFFNDAASFIARTTGLGQKALSKDGKSFAPWYVVAVFVVLGMALYFIVSLFMPRGKRGRIFSAILGVPLYGYLIYSGLYGEAGTLMTANILGTIAGASSGTIRSNFCPEYLVFNIATVPSSFRIDVAGDGVIFSLDGTGLTNLNGIRLVGSLPSNEYVYQIADGYIKKNTTLTITNADAAVLTVKGFSDSQGSMYNLHMTAQSFAAQSTTLEDFFYAAYPSAAATDTFTITFSDGTTDVLTREELEAYLAYRQQVTATRYNIDNFNQTIKYVQFIGAANQSYYWLRANAARGVVRQSA